MIGFLLQWPTIPTLVMFPLLVYIYARLARSEERAVADRFGPEWNQYAARTPAFVPRIRSLPPESVPRTPASRVRTVRADSERAAQHAPRPVIVG